MVIIGNRIYLSAKGVDLEKLKETLTYRIPPKYKGGFPIVIRNLKQHKKGVVSIPVGRQDLIPDGEEVRDVRTAPAAQFPDFKFTLRPSQQDILDKIDGNAIINAKVSFGKTFTALAIAAKFKLKTLVVVHTLALKNQWVEECEKVFGFVPDTIGGGKFDTSTPIVIANTRTLVKNLDKVEKSFGLLIVDEIHHIGAEEFSKITDAMWCKIKIGLSGTLERKDGKHIVMKDYFGGEIFKPPKENSLDPVVKLYSSNTALPDGMQWAQRINKIAYDENYQLEVSVLAKGMADAGHSVLVAADRLDFLEECYNNLSDISVLVTGSTSAEDRKKFIDQIDSKEKKVLFGTTKIFSEGISVNQLSCVILAMPINNEPLLEQLIGRIMRKKEGKLNPVVIDVILQGKTAKRQALARRGFYMKQGWKISQVN